MTGVARRVLVVGASAAGVTVCDSLRQHGFDGTVTLVGDEPHLPYDRPPLSKEVLAGTWDQAATALRDPGHYQANDIALEVGVAAAGVTPGSRTVQLADGRELPYDALVVATGSAARRLAGADGLAGVHVLRTLDDVAAFRGELDGARRVLVVGAGFLGSEVAATCRGLGVAVTLVDTMAAPLTTALGPAVGGFFAELHTEHGVELRPASGVREFESAGGRFTAAVLADGGRVAADVALVAVGARPATGWLAGSGLGIDGSVGGVACDETCRAAPDVYAAGDVAAWPHRGLGRRVRVEHRTNATEQAEHVARSILGSAEPFRPVPYVWSDHYGARLQAHGFTSDRHDFAVVEGGIAESRFVGLYGYDGRVTGAVGWRHPRGLRTARELVAAGAPWAEAVRDTRPAA